MPRAWRAAAMARASSWRRDHSTRSQPSVPADPTKVIEWRVSGVASRRGKREVERVTSRIGLFLPAMGYGGNAGVPCLYRLRTASELLVAPDRCRGVVEEARAGQCRGGSGGGRRRERFRVVVAA